MGQIMHPADMFNMIHTRRNYSTVGLNMDFKIHVERADQVLYVVFQGSNGSTDWFHNFLAIPSRIEPIDGCGFFVHKGFARVWRSGNEVVLDQLELRLGQRQFDGFQVCFGGFSHGGPLAMLAAHEWFTRTQKRERCIIFGSPKLAWGMNAVARLQESGDHTHWFNPADAVVHVPFSRWGFEDVDRTLVNVPDNRPWSILNINRQHQIYGNREIYPRIREAA